MFVIALELARENPRYQAAALRYLEYFLRVHEALNQGGPADIDLWDEADGFYYDAVLPPAGEEVLLKVRSLVGLVPLVAT